MPGWLITLLTSVGTLVVTLTVTFIFNKLVGLPNELKKQKAAEKAKEEQAKQENKARDAKIAALEAAVNALKDSLMFKDFSIDDSVSKVSIVGAGMETHPGVAAKMFESLYEVGINIQMISTSEIKVSVLIDVNESDRAVAAVHKAFIG